MKSWWTGSLNMAAKVAGSGRSGLLRRVLAPSRNHGGFTLVEVMIVVAIAAILCAIAIPFYLSYITRARVTTYIYPGLHSIESNIALYYATQRAMPTPADLPAMLTDADLSNFQVEMQSDRLKITVASSVKLANLNGLVMYAQPRTENARIVIWVLSGTLADRLGVSN